MLPWTRLVRDFGALEDELVRRWENAVLLWRIRDLSDDEDSGTNPTAMPGVYFMGERRHDLEPLAAEQMLNILGDEGWELAAVGTDASSVAYYVKRPRP